MRKLIYIKFAGKEIHMPKLIGAFILLAAALMFVKASADMFNSWDALRESEKCIARISTSLPEEITEKETQKCRDALYYNTGVYLNEGTGKPTSRQFWGALLGPIASVLLWLAVLFFGWILYRTGELVLPIQEDIREINEATSYRETPKTISVKKTKK